MWLWDSNIVRAYADREAEGHDRVLARGRAVGQDAIGLPIAVVAELLEGRLGYLREAHRLAPRQLVVAFRHLAQTLDLLGGFAVVPFDEGALDVYSQRRLFPGTMSRNDRLIAAIALAGGHILVTRNVSHFVDVAGLVIENWIDEAPSPERRLNDVPEIRELSERDEAAWLRNMAQAYRRGDRGDGTNRWPVDASIRRIGLFEKGDLVAQFALNSYEIFFGGKRVPMGGIAAVACLPLARGQGHVEALLWHGLERMREAGQSLSALHAFLVGLYRPMGWEWVGSQRRYTLPLAHLPRDLEPRSVRLARPDDVDALQGLYEADAARYRGMLVRDPSWWRERLEATTGHTHYFYVYERARPEGYLYLQMQEPARVRELIAPSPEAYRALLGVLRRHRAQLQSVRWTAPPDDPLWHFAAHWEIEVGWRPPFSGRVVDLPAAVALLSPDESLSGECVLQVEDPLTPWNTGVWQIAAEGGTARAERTTRTAEAACDIGAFSQLLFGDPDAAALRRAGRLSVTQERGFAFLRALCPPALCWMNDYF